MTSGAFHDVRSLHQMNFTDRHIRVFVSSTFRDMQTERDYLVKYTFSRLRKICNWQGIAWGDCPTLHVILLG